MRLALPAPPEPQLLGAEIGRRAGDRHPWLDGLEALLAPLPPAARRDYLKDMGAAAAATGAVGRFHAPGLTPEASDDPASVVPPPDAPAERIALEDLRRPPAASPAPPSPRRCIVGCPHLGLEQLHAWVERIVGRLDRRGRRRVAVDTLLCPAPAVREAFERDAATASAARRVGLRVITLCPLMFLNNPLLRPDRAVTPSAKLQVYTPARHLPEAAVPDFLAGEPDAEALR